jgi:type IV secretory pathway VirB10-like protein
MATAGAPNPSTLIVQARPHVPHYNRLLLYGGGIVLGIVALCYGWSLFWSPPQATYDQPVRLVSSGQPLYPAERREPSPTPPPPAPAPQPVSLAFLQKPTPPPQAKPRQPDPWAERRRQALMKALDAPVLVTDFSLDGKPLVASQNHTAVPVQPQPIGAPQTLEIPPAWPQEEQLPFGSPRQAASSNDPVGRQQQFWHQSSWGAASSQWLAAAVQPPRSPYQLNAGTFVPALLAQAITSDVEGTATAIVTQDVFDSISGHHRLIPQGARLFCPYDADVQSAAPRLNLSCKTLYFPNGYSLALNGMPGVDHVGMAGLSDRVNRHFWQRYGSAAVLSLITAGISLAVHQRGGFYTYSPQEAATYGAGQVLGQAVAEDLRQSMRIRPTITVPEAYRFHVVLTQDVVFPGPYPFASTQLAFEPER